MPTTTVSTELQAAIARVGEPREVFRCINVLLMVGALFGILLFAACVFGTVALVYFIATQEFDVRMLRAIMLPFIAGFGWITARGCFGQLGSRVLVCDLGFIYHHRRGVTVYSWDQITRVHYNDKTASLGPSGFPRVRNGSGFTVVRADGATYEFSVYTIRRFRKLARAIFDGTKPLGVTWSIQPG